jgi:hypothetical protein
MVAALTAATAIAADAIGRDRIMLIAISLIPASQLLIDANAAK